MLRNEIEWKDFYDEAADWLVDRFSTFGASDGRGAYCT